MSDGALNMLGLAKKAGKLEIGLDSVTACVRQGRAELILCAADCGESARRACRHLAQDSGAALAELVYTKAQLGAMLGRGSPGVIALTDTGLADSLSKKLAGAYPDRYTQLSELMSRRAQKLNIGKGKRRMKNESNV
ncbi:MAG: ribosomal L7Ae/L30e/S12e/Gadd45 family protein [Oscillospiraceae bacterium]|nr:ribosomal L7Ae/L30e/S12e/Gadd45 family protein [Oscillospiraceae bacterium]